MSASKANHDWRLLATWLTVGLLAGCGETVKNMPVEAKEVEFQRLVHKGDGLWHEPESAKPFTGVAIKYYPNGVKAWATTLDEGKPIGRVKEWDEEGKPIWPGNH